MASPLYVLILAGGSGERFWPLSRKTRPKQLLSLFGKETLLEGTLRRLEGLVDPAQILILTNSEQEVAVRSLALEIPRENILAEPAKRDTAAAIALGVGWIAARAAHATMAVLPADHLIQDTDGFQSTLRRAATAARETGDLVTIGIKPSWPCPGFGYIELGTPVTLRNGDDGPPIHEVIRFREKPSAELAETFLQQGGFRWNAGMFIWTIPAILGAFERHAPVLAEFVARIHGRGDFAKLLRDVFPTLPKISIDYAIMEKARRVLAVEAAFDWDDVGSWVAAAKYFEKDAGRNCGNTTVKAVDAADNIVFCNDKRMVALMGVNDLIIVQTADALLVCNRRDAEKIKNLVTELPPEMQ